MKTRVLFFLLAIFSAVMISCKPAAQPDPEPGPVAVTGVSLNPPQLGMIIGDEATLVATVAPANADNKAVTWDSNAPHIVSVAGGVIRALAKGNATITVQTVDGGFTATCAVAVTQPVMSVSKMEVETLTSMGTVRANPALFYTGDELVAAGGLTADWGIVTTSAEYCKDGAWHSMTMKAGHDFPFMAKCSDGKWLIGGGCASGYGLGQSKNVDLYDPSTHSFSVFPQLSTARSYSSALVLDNGDVVVSGNWDNTDGIEAYTPENESFSHIKSVSTTRYYPYILATASNNAIVTGPDGTVDCYKGEAYVPDLFQEWKPVQLGNCFCFDDFRISEGADNYSYLIALKKSSGKMAIGLVKNGDFSLLPTDFDVPARYNSHNIFYAGPIIADRSAQTAYMFGSNALDSVSNVTCYIVKIEYAAALSGGKAKISLYYSDPFATFPYNGYNSGIVLMPDGRLLVAGGLLDAELSTTNAVYAFKPF